MKRDTSKDPVYFHVILSNKELYENIGEDFFNDSPIKPIYEISRKYALRYKQAPSMEDLFSSIDNMDMDETDKAQKYDKARIKVIYSRKQEVECYGRASIEDEIRTIYRWYSLQTSLENGVAEFRLMNDQVTPDNVDKAITDVYMAIGDKNVVSFNDNDACCIDFWDPTAHKSENLVHWGTGFDFFDTCLDGGYWPGSLHLFLGAPKVGKSMWLCNLAARSVAVGNDTIYITLEMENYMVAQRIASCLLNMKQVDYKLNRDNEEELSKAMLRTKKGAVNGRMGELAILRYPTNSLSAVKMAELILKEEEKRSTPGHPFKFKTVFIDYISIMVSSLKDRSNMYLDGKRKAEEVRSQSQINQWCVVSAIQTNKEQYGSSDVNETQVSESSGYNATVDSMFGIIHDETIAAAGMYRIKNIYDRIAPYQGKSKMFVFSTDFLKMEECGDIIESSEAIAYKTAIKQDASVKAGKLFTGKGSKLLGKVSEKAPKTKAEDVTPIEDTQTSIDMAGTFIPPTEDIEPEQKEIRDMSYVIDSQHVTDDNASAANDIEEEKREEIKPKPKQRTRAVVPDVSHRFDASVNKVKVYDRKLEKYLNY